MKFKSYPVLLIGAFVLFILSITFFSYYEYQKNKADLYRQTDEKLLASAEGASLILTPGFYDRAVDASSITRTEDDRNIDRLSRFAKSLNVVYVYTMIQKNGKIYFTASSATDAERKSGINLTRYFDTYDDASKELKQVFATDQTRFAEYTDKWGTFRSVFIPMKSPGGRGYVVAADIRIDTIHTLLRKEAINLTVWVIAVIVFSLPLLTWRLRKANRKLLQKNEVLEHEIEAGEKNLKNTYERLQNLFDSMSEGVYEVDSSGNCTMVNKAFLRILGYERADQLLGKNIHELIHHSYPDGTFYPKHQCAMLKVFEHYSPVHVENEVFWSQDGKAVPVEYWSNPIIMDGEFVAAMATFIDISERKAAEGRIHYLANFDALTGLPNRQKLQFDIEQHHPYACAIFNIDNFKEMNDFFGIASGDTLLRLAGEWFKAMGFSPYRIGGDEFAVLFYEDLTQEQLHHRITALIFALDEEHFVVDNETLDMHMTVGVARGEGKLLTRADIAIHIAKERKLPIAFYEEAENIEEQYRVNIAMAGAIRKALVAGRIVCHYQPIVNITTGKIDKYETLVRMIDEEGNIVHPMQFLPIAKKTKLYSRITKEVVHQACRLFSTRSEEFSLNISIADIHDPATVQEIISTITRTGTASHIVFEILESEGIKNYHEVAEFINTVKKLGAKIAIDDFGTGYSNFEHVLKLNVDYIKIDGSLIQGTTSHSRHRIIVETIIDFANKIGTKTIAEFVSDEAIYNTVKELGINYSQGYYTGKPESIR